MDYNFDEKYEEVMQTIYETYFEKLHEVKNQAFEIYLISTLEENKDKDALIFAKSAIKTFRKHNIDLQEGFEIIAELFNSLNEKLKENEDEI